MGLLVTGEPIDAAGDERVSSQTIHRSLHGCGVPNDVFTLGSSRYTAHATMLARTNSHTRGPNGLSGWSRCCARGDWPPASCDSRLALLTEIGLGGRREPLGGCARHGWQGRRPPRRRARAGQVSGRPVGHPDDDRIVAPVAQEGRSAALFVLSLSGGAPRVIRPGGNPKTQELDIGRVGLPRTSRSGVCRAVSAGWVHWTKSELCCSR